MDVVVVVFVVVEKKSCETFVTAKSLPAIHSDISECFPQITLLSRVWFALVLVSYN